MALRFARIVTPSESSKVGRFHGFGRIGVSCTSENTTGCRNELAQRRSDRQLISRQKVVCGSHQALASGGRLWDPRGRASQSLRSPRCPTEHCGDFCGDPRSFLASAGSGPAWPRTMQVTRRNALSRKGFMHTDRGWTILTDTDENRRFDAHSTTHMQEVPGSSPGASTK